MKYEQCHLSDFKMLLEPAIDDLHLYSVPDIPSLLYATLPHILRLLDANVHGVTTDRLILLL
jgi:hypothetical protein